MDANVVGSTIARLCKSLSMTQAQLANITSTSFCDDMSLSPKGTHLLSRACLGFVFTIN